MRFKQSYILSVVSGILLSLPWLLPGQDLTLFVAFVPLLMSDDQLRTHKDECNSIFFLPAFVTFLIWNVLSSWWIAHVSLLGVLCIILLNALLMASVWWFSQLVRQKFGIISSWFSFVVSWLTFEFLHHNWTLPWPWLTLGNGFANSVEIIQWYEFTGVLGGSLWILLSNFLIFFLIKSVFKRSYSKVFKLAIIVAFVILVPSFWSIHHYLEYEETGSISEALILQPNINPYTEKFSGMNPDQQVDRLMSLARSNISDSTCLIIAPETAWPSLWEDSALIQKQSLRPVLEIIKDYPDVSFITGAITQKKIGKEEPISETARRSDDGSYYFDVFNSALMIDRTSLVQISHKSILVNGVERMPFQRYLAFLDEYILHLGGTAGSLAAAKEPCLFSNKTPFKIGPIICFESVFGEFSGNMVKRGANLLVVLTNDGWWKDSPGTWQHFSYSRLRAVETRRCIVRSANTGISGFINQRGDVLKKSGVNSFEALSSPVRVNTKITFYVSYGDYLGKISTFLAGLTVIYWLICYLRNKGIKKSALIRL